MNKTRTLKLHYNSESMHYLCSTASYLEYKRLQQQSVHLLWDSECASRDADTVPDLTQLLSISLHSLWLHQLRHLLASSMFPDKREAQKTNYHSAWHPSSCLSVGLDRPVMLWKSFCWKYSVNLNSHFWKTDVHRKCVRAAANLPGLWTLTIKMPQHYVNIRPDVFASCFED